MGDEAVIRAHADGEAVVDHKLDGVFFQTLEFRDRLQVGRGADLDGDTLVGDVFAELLDIAELILHGLVLGGFFGNQERSVAYAVGVALGNSLENGFGAVGLARVDGFAQKIAVTSLSVKISLAARSPLSFEPSP